MRRLLSSSHCDATDQAGPEIRRSRGRRRGFAARRSLAVLVGCIALFVLAPVAAAQAAVTLEGTVTAVKGGNLKGIEVTATSEEGGVSKSTTSETSGAYKITSLSKGAYTVTFSDPTAKYVEQEKSDTLAEGINTLNAAMQESGTISGRVTSAATGSGLGSVTVYVDKVGGAEFFYRYTTTGSEGYYSIAALPPGTYEVEFYPNDLSGYLYQRKTTTLGEGAVDTVNAELKEGGKISGTVTDSVAHKGLAKIGVRAYTANPETEGYSSGYAETNANGEYTVTGLANGSYKVEFYWEYSEAEYTACDKEHKPLYSAQCPTKYITQYFNNQPTEVAANSVGAAEGSTTSGINAVMVPSAPVNTALPAVSGTVKVGSLLSCSTGSWTGDSLQAPAMGWPLISPFTYQWQRDGATIAGATTAAYLVQTADVGHGLTCEVTATNDAGKASAKSNPFAVTLPAVTVSSAKIVVSGGKARVPISCTGGACAGTIELTGKVKGKKKPVVLGKGAYSLAAGKKATIAVGLTAAGKGALGKAKGHRLSAKAGVSVTGGKKVLKAVVLGPPAKKPKHKGKKK